MKVTLDRKKCLRSGQCIYLHPKVFKEGPDGYPVLQYEGDLPEDIAHEADDAADACPSGAIDTVAG